MKRNELMLRLSRALVRRRTSLRKTLAGNTSQLAANNRTVGDLIDAAVDCEQDELDSQLADAESRELAAIDEALDRIREGCYGTCDHCEKPIPIARLEAVPHASLCIKCQREQERIDRGKSAICHWESEASLSVERERSNGLGFGMV